MRSLTFGSLLVPAALLAGCSPDRIQGPAPSPGMALVERSQGRPDPEFTYTVIEVPGALATVAFGINAQGDIVGNYVDASFRSHGFVLRDGAFTTIDFPNAGYTDARGIGPNGEIVGTYRMPGEPTVNNHGYLLAKGEFSRIDYPGHINTIPQRILPDGTLLGCRHDHDTMESMRGITIDREGSSEIAEFASMNNGATPDGKRITGLYTNMDAGNRTEGYIIEDGVFTPFIVPGSTSTAAWDMNPAGAIVGNYRNASGFHGFVRVDERYLTLDVPGATATRAFGINARGDVVGSFISGGTTRGFLATSSRGGAF
jgi:uncharacterized membrane protein